jgi:two-component system phosphate regulon sensor histidine kinase PhoR
MRRKPLFWKLFPIYFGILSVSFFTIAIYASEAFREFYLEESEADLLIRARLISRDVRQECINNNPNSLRTLVARLAKESATRVTIIATDGRVLADSHHDPATMLNHAGRPEVRQILNEGRNVGMARRVSPTLGDNMVYVATPIKCQGKIIGVLRLALAASALDAEPGIVYRRVLLATLLIALIAGIVTIMASSKITGPLSRMEHATSRFASGDFRFRLPTSDIEELASLADTLNSMAAQLDRQLRTITQQAEEQRAILSSMKEGVLATDNDDRILILNPTAEQLLGITLENSKGKTIQEAIRYPALQKFIERAHASPTPTRDEFSFYGPEERLVELVSATLKDTDGTDIGVLVVLNDITQTRRLENMRKDFVANVSHELRTPITSIKGFVETLREGALSDQAKAKEFLDILARQADRLNSIIEDLLTLSRIEQQTETDEVDLHIAPVRDVLTAAVSNCENRASTAGVTVTIDCAEDLRALINPPLLEQAVTNLVDNAIKYAPGGLVEVTARHFSDDEIVISVKDNGCGIEPEHLPRLFERFYRVDKARSRKLGGTGLGLAIVKHIIQAHQGRTEVESSPGLGSTFSIYLRTKAKANQSSVGDKNDNASVEGNR